MQTDPPRLWILVYTDGLEGFQCLGAFSSQKRAVDEAIEHRGEGELRLGEGYELHGMVMDQTCEQGDEAEELHL